MLTGLAVPIGSWTWLERWWITAPLVVAVLAWWTLFLWIVPQAVAQAAREEMASDQKPQQAGGSGQT